MDETCGITLEANDFLLKQKANTNQGLRILTNQIKLRSPDHQFVRIERPSARNQTS